MAKQAELEKQRQEQLEKQMIDGMKYIVVMKEIK